MTTLFCDKEQRTLYCDGRITIGDSYQPAEPVQKFHVIDIPDVGECLVGLSGTLDAGHIVLRYFSGEIKERPNFDENTIQGFIIPRDKAHACMVFFGDTVAPYPVPSKRYSLGSGYLIARAIADYTGDIREGMRFACLRDPHTGFPFYRVRWTDSGLDIKEYTE